MSKAGYMVWGIAACAVIVLLYFYTGQYAETSKTAPCPSGSSNCASPQPPPFKQAPATQH
ncbi:MAG TPA: hypothetical protein VN723_01970 [Rhizomicrobium sp.]|jgi:hypothetical protein|nr:hypothetical protein [Rhizomicrobium sp.]